MKRITLGVSAALLLLASSAVQAQPGYSVTDFGTLGGYLSQANGINSSGQVIGNSNGHAFVYNGAMNDLGTLLPGGYPGYSAAYAINNTGQVVGQATAHLDSTHAFLYSG